MGTNIAEQKRLEAVERYKLLDFDKNQEFQNIANLAAEICRTPAALITLLDEDTNWYKARVGTDIPAMPRATSFCQYTVQHDELMIVPDTLLDQRFTEYPMVTNEPGIRFYAGGPLAMNDGNRVGSLCVIDVQPKTLTDIQQKTLEVLSKQVAYIMELELSQLLLKEKIKQVEKQNKTLINIAQVQSHEVRGPLSLIIGLMNLIKENDYQATKEYMVMMDEAVQEMDEKVQRIVKYTGK